MKTASPIRGATGNLSGNWFCRSGIGTPTDYSGLDYLTMYF